jgi:hypothetical protein
MGCQIAVQNIDYTFRFDQPVLALPTRHLDVLGCCYRRVADDYPLQLADLQSLGGVSLAESCARIALPALGGSAEIRVDRLSGQFSGVTSHQQSERTTLVVSQCNDAFHEVFPEVAIASTSISIMSWLSCDGGRSAVEDTLKARQKIEFDARTIGADTASFSVRGNLRNEAEAWSIAFGLEPSTPVEFDLYFVTIATYAAVSGYTDFGGQSAHTALMLRRILDQFGFELGER